MYAEELQDHFKFPRNKKKLECLNAQAEELNPSCGDRIRFEIYIQGNKIVDLGFAGEGCVISQAAASMLGEEALKKNVDELLGMTKDDLLHILSISLGPTRLRCALLSLEVLQKAVLAWKNNNI